MEKPLLLSLSILIFLMATSIYAISPVIDSAGQRRDGSKLFDVWYGLYDLGGECVEVRIKTFTASGETLTCETFIEPSDTGEICSEGSGYHIIWDIGTDEPNREFYTDGISLLIQAYRPGGEPGICDCPPIVTDIDGNTYETIQIGWQCWMKENLKTTHYRDGTPIPTGFTNTEWEELDVTETGAYAEYDDDPSNVATYGRLYNWYAVDDAHGLCPDGWHVPTDDEWKTLEMYLGMSETEADGTGYRGTNEGSKLAGRADLWRDGDLEADPEFGTSGFTALPGGYRYFNGIYANMSRHAAFWSSSEYSSTNAWDRFLYYYLTGVDRLNANYKRYGFSVRCVRD